MIILFLLSVMFSIINSFQFREVSVFSDTTVISVAAEYTFIFERYHNNLFIETNWATQTVSSAATMTITFPNDYTLSSETCKSLTINSNSISGFTCSISANTLTVDNAFTSISDLAIYDVQLVIDNVVNPSPAVFTGQFSGSIGDDTAQPNGGGIQLTAGSFQSCTVNFDTAVVNESSTMILILNPTNQLSTSAYVVVTLPQTRVWTNDISGTTLPLSISMTCSNITNTNLPTCVGDLSPFTLTASAMLTSTTIDQFSFGITNFQSPPTLQPSDIITITSFESGFQVDTCSVYVTDLIPNTFSSLTIVPISGSMVVNTVGGLRITMVFVDFVNQNDEFQITFPAGIDINYANVTGTGSFDTSSVAGQVLTVTQKTFVTRTYSSSQSFIINFYNFTAPTSTQVSDPIEVTITKNGYSKMTGTTTIQADPSTVSGAAAASVTTVWATTSYQINITTLDPLSSSGMIKIIFPSSITPELATSCATLVGTNVVTSPTCTLTSAQNSVTISAMNSSSSDIGIQTIQVTVLGVRNAPSIAPSSSFSVQTYYSSSTDTLVATGTISGVTASTGTISSSTVSVDATSLVVLDSSVTYTLSFTNTYEIPSGGSIQITIPDDITLDIASVSSYCKLTTDSGTFLTTDCTGSTQTNSYFVSFPSIAQGSSIAAGTNISLRIQSLFTNPVDTRIVSSFTIATFSDDTYEIENLNSGISIQMTTPSTMQTTSVTRSSNLNSDATVSYTVQLTQKPAMQASSKLLATFPSELQLTSSSTCTDLSSNALTCTHVNNVITVNLGTSAITALSPFGVIVTNVINPPSFQPITGFYFITKTSNQINDYAQKTTTATLSNSLPSSFTSVSSSFSNRVYGEATNLEITITPSTRIIPDYIIVSIASSFSISSLTCISFVGFSATCSNPSSHTLRVDGTFTSSSMTFTVSGLTAPTASPNDYSVLSSYDSNDYQIDQSLTDIFFSIECTLPCKTCSSNTSVCNSCYSDTSISTFVYYYSDTNTCQQICPSGTYEDTGNLRCVNCNSICLQCDLGPTNCTSCSNSSSYPYLNKTGHDGTCLSGCPIYYYPDANQYPVLCVPCISPCQSCTDQITCQSCVDGFYFYNGNCQSSCPSGTAVPNDITNQCDPCDSQCAECSTTVDNCTSCSSSAALHDGDCVTSCPAPLVINAGACSSCDSICLTCDTVSTNCTSCNTSSANPYLHNNDCFTTCPQFFYQDIVNGICISCSTLSIGCVDCLTSSTCDNCDADYVFLNNKCYTTAPTGYANISGIAEPCTGDCQTCEGLQSNCTSCLTLNLDGNDCVTNCIDGEVPVNRVCEACTSPCKVCSNIKTNCTSCESNLVPEVFLSNNDCVVNCPDYTFQDFSNNQCTACSSPCQKCQSSTSCQTCLNGFFLYNTTCDTDCPFGFLGVGRLCQPCTSPCQDCETSLTNCLSCLDGYYFLSTTNQCTQTCPTGLYPNDITDTCTGCTAPCDTCTNTSTTCLSCLSGLLHDSGCVSSCPDGFYELNSECFACDTGCATCLSSSTCQTCEFGYYFYNNFCLTDCPPIAPVIDSSSNCIPCSDSNCLVCDSLDQCSSCNYPTLLHLGACLDSCPTDYSANGTQCIYDPQPTTPTDNNNTDTNNTDNNSPANDTLNDTLASSDYFPVPFTIGGTFLGIACLMSKFQYQHTFISGALYSLWSIMEISSIAVVTYLYVIQNTSSIVQYYVGATSTLSFTVQYLQALIFFGAVLFMYLLNFIALFAQNCYLRGDTLFNKWLRTKSNLCCYYVLSVLGVVFTHKIKNLMFSKLFNFSVFKAQLDSVQNFRIFHVFTFLSFLPSIAILYAVIKLLIDHKDTTGEAILVDQLLMAYIDIIIVVLICMILGIFSVCKNQDFFEEPDEHGYIMNKRIVQSDQIMHEAIVPMMMEDEEVGGHNYGKNIYETSRKFQSYDETYTQSQSQTQVKLCNISIQAAPMLQDYSNVKFYDDNSLSDLSLFKKVDRSINVSHHEEEKKQVSVQHEPNIFEKNQASMQFNPQQHQVSVQNDVEKEDLSLQYGPVQNDQGMQMSRHDEQYSIQCGPLVNNMSVQYSAKPVYESRSQQILQSSSEEDITESKELGEQKNNRIPFKEASQLKQQLELDVQEKMRRQEYQKELQRQERLEKQKAETIRNFQKEQAQKEATKSQKKYKDEVDAKQINELFNNDDSRRDGSSLMDSNANIMIRFNKRKTSQDQSQKKERVPSAKTEKQFIDLLSKKQENNLQHNSSLSFNVTKDLQAQNEENNKIKNVFFEEQDRVMDSDEDAENEEISPNRRNVILRNDTQEELPSGVQKSRSTNFRSTVKDRRKPPLPYNSGYSNNLFGDTSKDQMQESHNNEDEEIIHKPMQSKSRGRLNRPQTNFKQEQLDFEARTNLNNFYERRNRNSISAQYLKKGPMSEELSQENSNNKLKSKQQPLPMPFPKIQRIQSQQSDNNDDKMYRISSKKLLLQGKRMDLEFMDDDKIEVEEQQQQPKKQLPRVWKSESRLKSAVSKKKFGEQKPVQREILKSREGVFGRTQQFLQKQQRKAEKTKKKIEEIQVLLERPGGQKRKGYQQQTYSSGQKKRKNSLQRVYMNKPTNKRQEY